MKTLITFLTLIFTMQVFADATIEVNFGEGVIRGEDYGYETQELKVVCNTPDCGEIYFTKNGARITRVISKRNFVLKTTDYGMVKEPWRADHTNITATFFAEGLLSKEALRVDSAFDIPFIILTPAFLALGAMNTAVVMTFQELVNLPRANDLRVRRLKSDLKARAKIASVLNKVSEAKEAKLSYAKFMKLDKSLRKQFPAELLN